MDQRIFGYEWSDIQRAQSGGNLQSPVRPAIIKSGDKVRYREINLWPSHTDATVVSVKGNSAMVIWRHCQTAVEEWVPNLMLEPVR